MKHFNYFPLYEDIRKRQKQELINALKKFPNHEFHFGMDYIGNDQKEMAEHPYIIGYLGEEPVDLKVMAVREKNGSIYIMARDERSGVDWVQGSTYLTRSDDLSNMFAAIQALSRIDWFKKSVRDIRGYKVENWSNFTDLVKNS